MQIIILTSADHPYANALLVHLIHKGVFAGDTVTVFEQTWLIPRLPFLRGLLRYLRTSGLHLVAAQGTKVLLFRFVRLLHLLLGRSDSSFFPYDHLGGVALKKAVLQDFRDPQHCACLRALQPDLLLSLFSREILPSAVLGLPRYGSVNLHPALLPHYRGVSPTFWCLANGERRTGVTLHVMGATVDGGDILGQREVRIAQGETEHALYMRCVRIGAELLASFLQELRCTEKMPQGSPPIPGGSYYSLPTKEAVRKFRERGYRFFTLREILFPESIT